MSWQVEVSSIVQSKSVTLVSMIVATEQQAYEFALNECNHQYESRRDPLSSEQIIPPPLLVTIREVQNVLVPGLSTSLVPSSPARSEQPPLSCGHTVEEQDESTRVN
jgi:hypothetical protein